MWGGFMSFVKTTFATFAFLTVAGTAQAFQGQCVLNVAGRNYLNGACEVEMIDKDGSFTLGASDKAPSPYFAYVVVTEPGVAEASWNADPKATHAHASLGILKRRGACWVNEKARICATR